MKLKSKAVAIGSIIALIASPLAMADKAQGGDAGAEPEPIVEVAPDVEVVITVEPEEGEVVDGEIIECEPGVDCEHGEPVLEKDPVDGEVPIDWVKRGGEEVLENPDVIFYNMADGGGAAPVAAKGDIELGQDDKAAAIEAKGAGAAPQISREKKGPVALVKKGRVFLR